MKRIFLFLVYIPLFSMDQKPELKVRVESFIPTTPYEEPLSAQESPTSISPTSKHYPTTPYPRPSSTNPFLDTMLSKHRRIVETLESLGKESDTNRKLALRHQKKARDSKKKARESEHYNKRNKVIGAVSTVVCSLLTYLFTQYSGKCSC